VTFALALVWRMPRTRIAASAGVVPPAPRAACHHLPATTWNDVRGDDRVPQTCDNVPLTWRGNGLPYVSASPFFHAWASLDAVVVRFRYYFPALYIVHCIITPLLLRGVSPLLHGFTTLATHLCHPASHAGPMLVPLVYSPIAFLCCPASAATSAAGISPVPSPYRLPSIVVVFWFPTTTFV